MTESPEESVASDLPTVAEDHEATILVLQARVGKLKGLLAKAKALLGEQRHKSEELESKLESERELTSILRSRLEKLEDRSVLQPHEVISVLARVKVDSDLWALVRTVNSTEQWAKESQVQWGSDVLLPEAVDSSCTQSAINAQVEMIVKQYEDRMQRMQCAVENAEDSLRDVKKAYKVLQEAFKEREAQIQSNDELMQFIAESQEIYEKASAVVLEDSLRSESLTSLQDLLFTYQQREAKESQRPLKAHITALHTMIIDVARRFLHCRKEQQAQETAWRATCDSLVNEKEELKGSLNRVRNDFARKVEENERKLAALTLTYSQETLQKNQEIAGLRKELENAVNTPYLRKVVVQFLTSSDPSVTAI